MCREKTTRRRGRDGAIWSDSYRARNARLAGSPQGLGRSLERMCPGSLQKSQPRWHLACGRLASRTVREQMSIVPSHLICGILLQKNRTWKWIQASVSRSEASLWAERRPKELGGCGYGAGDHVGDGEWHVGRSHLYSLNQYTFSSVCA